MSRDVEQSHTTIRQHYQLLAGSQGVVSIHSSTEGHSHMHDHNQDQMQNNDIQYLPEKLTTVIYARANDTIYNLLLNCLCNV